MSDITAAELVDRVFADIATGELEGMGYLILRAIAGRLYYPRDSGKLIAHQEIATELHIGKTTVKKYEKLLEAGGYLCWSSSPKQHNGKDGTNKYRLGPKVLSLLDTSPQSSLSDCDRDPSRITTGVAPTVAIPFVSGSARREGNYNTSLMGSAGDRGTDEVETNNSEPANVNGMSDRNFDADAKRLLAKPEPEPVAVPDYDHDAFAASMGNAEATSIGGIGRLRTRR